MMERLTEKHYLGNGYYMKCTENCNGEDIDCIDCAALDKLVDRLGAYEDTGLTPGEVRSLWSEWNAMLSVLNSIGSYDHLRELAQADKEGRLVVLPATEVFELTWDAGPGCDLECPLSIDGNGCCDMCGKGVPCLYSRECKPEHICRIGHDIFLTREEAEQALKEAKK